MQTKERVKEIFKEYRALETKRKVFTAAGKSTPELEEFAIVATCIESLDDESKDIINSVYKRGMSIREYAKRNYLSHPTVYRRIDAAAQTIADCFQ
jgi:DNA-directed RNA polymerase specialized sigma subunit